MTLLDTLRTLRSKPSQRTARFVLYYATPDGPPVTVGHLDFDGRTWAFTYDDEYKGRPDLRPIEGFDAKDKVYRSSVLFPFFAVRIPDAERDDVQRELAKANIRHPEPVDLLQLFGRRTVSSPAFELLPCNG